MEHSMIMIQAHSYNMHVYNDVPMDICAELSSSTLNKTNTIDTPNSVISNPN